VRKVRLARIADREQVEMPTRAGEVEAVRQRAPVFAVVRATASITGSAWGKSLKTRIVDVGGLRIIALGTRFEADGQELSVAPFLNPAAELARKAPAALALNVASSLIIGVVASCPLAIVAKENSRVWKIPVCHICHRLRLRY
jgi:hypothetical protein